MRRIALATLALALLGGFPAAAVEEESDETAAAFGRITYVRYCRSCHGREARGDGPVAEVLKVPPTDLTRIAANNDGEFDFDAVRSFVDGRDKDVRPHGSADMPIWGEAFQAVDEGADEAEIQMRIDRLVHYLESIQEDGD